MTLLSVTNVGDTVGDTTVGSVKRRSGTRLVNACEKDSVPLERDSRSLMLVTVVNYY